MFSAKISFAKPTKCPLGIYCQWLPLLLSYPFGAPLGNILKGQRERSAIYARRGPEGAKAIYAQRGPFGRSPTIYCPKGSCPKGKASGPLGRFAVIYFPLYIARPFASHVVGCEGPLGIYCVLLRRKTRKSPKGTTTSGNIMCYRRSRQSGPSGPGGDNNAPSGNILQALQRPPLGQLKV